MEVTEAEAVQGPRLSRAHHRHHPIGSVSVRKECGSSPIAAGEGSVGAFCPLGLPRNIPPVGVPGPDIPSRVMLRLDIDWIESTEVADHSGY